MSWFDDNAYVPPSGNTGISGGGIAHPGTLLGFKTYQDWVNAGSPGGGGGMQPPPSGMPGGVPLSSLAPGSAPAAPGTIGQGLEQSPGFQFRLGEGLKALERSAAARGTLLTGGTLKGLQRYAQDYASGEYGQRVNQLSNLAALGLNAAGGAGNAASSYGQHAGDLLTQAGNAQAAGQVGAANAWAGGISGGINNALQMYYLSRMFPGAGAVPGAPSTGPIASGVPAGLPGAQPPWIYQTPPYFG